MDYVPLPHDNPVAIEQSVEHRPPITELLTKKPQVNDTQTPGSTLDPNSLSALRAKATKDPQSPKAIHEASKQVEALFIANTLKQFRSASKPFESNLFSSTAGETYNQMLDTQLSQTLANKGMGIGKMFESQLLLKSKQTKLQGGSGTHQTFKPISRSIGSNNTSPNLQKGEVAFEKTQVSPE